MGKYDNMGEYDHVRCTVCGVPWLKHDRACPRDPFRPTADIANQTVEQIIPLLIAPELVKAQEYGPLPAWTRIGFERGV